MTRNGTYVSKVLAAALLTAAMAGNAFADFTIGPGETWTLTAGETFTIDGNLTIDATGTLDASAGGTNIILNGNWTNNGTFTAGDGTVTFTNTPAVLASTITGATTFNNLTCTTASKQLTFESGVTQTINGTLTLNGQAAGTRIQLRSTSAGTRFTLDVTAGAQSVDYVDVMDSQVSTNDIVALDSVNSGGNDDAEASPHWAFGGAILDMRNTVADDNGGSLLAGETLTYTIILNNNGGTSATNAVITDSIPANTTYVANSTTLSGAPAADTGGNSPLLSGLNVGTLNSGATATATFKATVNNDVVSGAVISNQASALADGLSNPELSDEPNIDSDGDTVPTNENDPTIIVVESAAVVNALKTVTDMTGGSPVAIGDTLRYTIVINNVGNAAATGVVFTDIPDTDTTYTAGTITLAGVAKTDASGDDEADYNVTTANTITVSVGTIAAGSSATIKFDVTVNAVADGTLISNQGTVTIGNTPNRLTDADGNASNGNQATTTVVGSQPILALIKDLTDLNGGSVEAGDTLVYTLTFSNTGTAAATGVVITDTPDTDTTYTPGTITLAGAAQTDASDSPTDETDYNVTTANTITVNAGDVAAGDSVTVTYEVTVNAVGAGTEITNSAQADDTDAAVAAVSDSVTVDVGGADGVAGFTGRLYLDRDQDDTYTAGEELAGWTIEYTNSCGNTYQSTTDASGNYVLQGVSTPENYTAKFYNAAGTQFGGDLVVGTVNPGHYEVNQNLPVDPSGYVYDSATGQIVAGAQVALYESGVLVPAVDLFGTPNPQPTDALGFYQFLFLNATVPPNKTFEIRVTPPAGYILSANYPPVVNDVTAGLLTITPAGNIDAPAAGFGNVDDKNAPPFNIVGGLGALYRYSFFIEYGAGEFGEVLQNNIPLDPLNSSSLRITKDANKRTVAVGDIVTYTVTIENTMAGDVSDVILEALIPAGFKYLRGKAILDGAAISDPTGTRPVSFDIGTVAAGATRTLKYQLIVGAGVSFDEYKNVAQARHTNGTALSNTTTKKVYVVPDPLFDLGTVIGKVFGDRNENGIQDKGDEPIGNVRIVTEEGTIITTDKNGMYHLAAVKPGMHAFKIDVRTLPEGASLTTDETAVMDVYRGMLHKVNFGVKLTQIPDARQMPFEIDMSQDAPSPRLNVSLFDNELVIKDGKLAKPAVFGIFTNYQLFIEKWKLEILDKDTKFVKKMFEGTADNISDPIHWDGISRHGSLIRTDRSYAYRLTVTGSKGKKDVTKEADIAVTSYDSQVAGIDDTGKSEKDRQEQYKQWLEQESKVSNLEKQTIRIEGQTVRITGSKYQVVRILKGNKLQAELPVVESSGLRAKDLLTGRTAGQPQKQSELEVILPNGEYDLQVNGSGVATSDTAVVTDSGSKSFSSSPASDGQTYTQHIQVGDDYMFLVALGDGKVGYSLDSGNIEPLQDDDRYEEGFWSEGKLAFYLKGKVKGKYLVTASFDSERDKIELFRNLDPDKYYPVYGDDSSVNYQATNTQGMLYALVEWDKSSAVWGNYNTAFTDTEFAQFSRSLYGGKVDFESLSTTKFGDPESKLVVFRAQAHQKAAHNELLGTGGSLYYLKHKDIIEGSDKIAVEVRDKTTGLVLSTTSMQEGIDYEIDYSNGRITFWQPVSHVTKSGSIISSNLLDGNPVYVVVDYEYEVRDRFDEMTVGVRVKQAITDNVVIGGTYVEEDQTKETYKLEGVDATVYLSKDIKVIAEYAESESEATGSFISTDGGLSFTELPTAETSTGRAYGVKGAANLFDNKLGIESYYKRLDNDFSTSATSSQQGKELAGISGTYDLSEKTRVSVSHDVQKLLKDGNPQTQLQIGATKTATSSAQIVHDSDKLRLTGEYRHQEVKERKSQFESETNREEDTVAVRADYKLTEKTIVSVEQQSTISGESNNVTSVGIETKVTDSLALRAEEVIGSEGTATSIGATANVGGKLDISGDLTRTDYKNGHVGNTAAVGASTQLNEKTEIHGTFAQTEAMDQSKTSSMTFGSKRKINDELEFTTDNTFASSGDRNTIGRRFGFLRNKDGRTLEGTFTREQSESSTEVSNSNIFGLSGDINDKWAFSGTFERGKVQNHDGTRATRNAGGIGLGYVDRDEETGEIKLKASVKTELRFDDGNEDKRQYLVYTAVEGKVNPDTTLFAKANLSKTENTTTDRTDAQYKELVFGTAYRPIDFDWLNLLAKYTYLEDDSPVSQIGARDIEHEKAHILAGEAVFDVTDKWQLTEKLAYKTGREKVSGFDFTKAQTWLWATRLSYKMDENWYISGEYRLLTQQQAKDKKHGFLLELTRELDKNSLFGVGYNFADFSDDLAHQDYSVQGPYLRMTYRY